jgi:VanZ family protein
LSRILGTNTSRRNVAGFLPAALWAILVTVLSLSSVAVIPSVGWADFAGIDKAGHVVFYCIMALWIFYGFFRLSKRYRYMAVWTVMFCACFGISMELLQGIMRAGRQFEYPDIAANVLGALLALMIYNIFFKKTYRGDP